jgi:hypothetical protein
MQPVYQSQRLSVDEAARTASQQPASSLVIRNPHTAPHSRSGLLRSLRPSQVPIDSSEWPHPRSDQHQQEAEGRAQEAPVASSDFTKIPVFPPDRPNRPHAPSPFAAPLGPGSTHTNLAIGWVDDPLEHEAENVAEQVIPMPDPGGEEGAAAPRAGQARSADVGGDEVPGLVHEVLRSPGQPLDPGTRAFFEPRLGHDFSSVRVHADAAAAASARAVRALAYTVGRDLVFGEAQYAPETATGRNLLTHELAHVLQPTSMTPIMGNSVFKIGRADDPAECAAESAARSLESPTEPSPWPIKTSLSAPPLKTSLSAPPPALRPLPALASDAAVLRRQAAPGATPVSPELLNRPSKGYVDDFENVVYDIDYRGVPRGSLSKWLQVHYRDGTKIDINIDSIIDKSVGPEESEDLKRSGRIGEGGRIFPAELNSGTTPRLAAAKRQALIVMDDYNALFIMGTFSAVWLIITTAGAPPLGELPPATRRPISRIPGPPSRQLPPGPEPGEKVPPGAEPIPPSREPSPGAEPSTKAPGPRVAAKPPGSRAASVEARAAQEAAAQKPPPLTQEQAAFRDTLIEEHKGLNPQVASEASKGAAKVMGPGGEGADVLLLSGGGREVSVHTGAFTPGSVGGHLQTEAMQKGTTEIYLQINSQGASQEKLLSMIPRLRTAYLELRGITVRIFGPNGQQWWSGTFGGP